MVAGGSTEKEASTRPAGIFGFAKAASFQSQRRSLSSAWQPLSGASHAEDAKSHRRGSVGSCNTYTFTNQPTIAAFYLAALTNDSDGDHLSDAYEKLVSKTDPFSSENFIQTENA